METRWTYTIDSVSRIKATFDVKVSAHLGFSGQLPVLVSAIAIYGLTSVCGRIAQD